MRCASCSFDNPDGARFCVACGERLPLACPACHAPVAPEHRFCPACGQRLAGAAPAGAPSPPPPGAGEGERRQVTVLFVDLAGYTELAGRLDAEEVHGLLEGFFDRVDRLIGEFGGTVDKHIGDCVMGVFGAPVAYGNDPERAARAALAIRDAMPALGTALGQPLAVHIGLATGQVVASPTGSAAHRAYTVIGESVNLAARLTDQAAAGEILIAETVHRSLPEAFRRSEAGTFALQGLAGPVHAWRLHELRPAATPAARPFVGRRAELAQFEGVLAACRETGCGQTIYLRGEAGIGKTRLVEEFLKRAQAAGFAGHVALVLDFGAGKGQDAVRALVRSLLGVPPGADNTARADAAARAVDGGLVADARRVFLNELLDLPQPLELRALYDAMDIATRNRGQRETVELLVRAIGERQPLMLVVEDLHWADAATLDRLAALAEATATSPVLLVMTSRLEGDPLERGFRSEIGASPLITIDLAVLRPQEANALAQAYADVSNAFVRRCIARAAGNPLFLEQLLRHADEQAEAGVPGSVQSLVQARLDRLGAADKQAVQAASVFGQRFALAPLRELLGVPDYDCGGLVRHFLVRPLGADFLFAHALIRDAIYDSLLKARRRELHRKAAAWFAGRDPALHAEHLDRAGDPGAPEAYARAARAEAAAYRYERALALARRGLELSAAPGERSALACLTGELCHDLGAMAEARAAYEQALEAAASDADRATAWLGLAAVKRVVDELDGALADLDRAETAARGLDLTAALARVHFLRGNLYFPMGRIEQCLAEHQRGLELARAAGSAELEAQALGGLGDAEYARGRIRSSGAHFRACVAHCRRHGFGRIEVASLPMVAIATFYEADMASALSQALDAIEAAVRVGHQRAEMIAQHIAFICRFERTEFDPAAGHVEHALELSRRLGARRFEAEALGFQGNLEAARGEHVRAAETLRSAVAISRETDPAYFGAGLFGWLALATDDPQERRTALAEGEALLAAGAVSHNHFFFRRAAMEVALHDGDWPAAERHAEALADYTRAEPLPFSDFAIERARALAGFGRGLRDDATLATLDRLCERARRGGLHLDLPHFEAALAVVEPTPPPAS